MKRGVLLNYAFFFMLGWLLTLRMDYLLISRSGFGETSSWYSGVPTFHIDRDKKNMNCRFKENDRSNQMMGILGEGW
jgi:hypothetical protein